MIGAWIRLAEAWEKLVCALRRLFRRPVRNEGGFVAYAPPVKGPRARVKAGAALLDERQPGWDRRVDTATLRIESVFFCVLGQTFITYGRGMHELGITGRESRDYGFNSATMGFEMWSDFADLNREWRREIARRQSV